MILLAIIGVASAFLLDEKNIKRRIGPKCDEDEAVEIVRKIVKQWPDYVNTGNQKFLIKNWINCEASITQTGSALDSFCQTTTNLLVDKLAEDRILQVLSETVNVKRIRLNECNENVIANFVLASGHRGFNLSLSNESWVFTNKHGCDYRVSEAVSVKLECLKQENNCPIPF